MHKKGLSCSSLASVHCIVVALCSNVGFAYSHYNFDCLTRCISVTMLSWQVPKYLLIVVLVSLKVKLCCYGYNNVMCCCTLYFQMKLRSYLAAWDGRHSPNTRVTLRVSSMSHYIFAYYSTKYDIIKTHCILLPRRSYPDVNVWAEHLLIFLNNILWLS